MGRGPALTDPSPCLFLQLFELLGPDGLEMISTLLQKRTAVVGALTAFPPERSSHPPGQRSPVTPAEAPSVCVCVCMH